jgi:hypothetical protein
MKSIKSSSLISSDLSIDSPAEQAATTAADIFYWGSLTAQLRLEADKADTQYRAWRAQKIQAILMVDAKLAEWKARATAEAHPDFIRLRDARSEARKSADHAHATHQAYIHRASMIQTMLKYRNQSQPFSSQIGDEPKKTIKIKRLKKVLKKG